MILLDTVRDAREARNCAHYETITTGAGGLERELCMQCNHVSVRYLSELTGDIDRAVFARPADKEDDFSSWMRGA